MRKEDKTSMQAPIPSGTSPDAVIAVLHDHEFLIKLGSAIESHKLTSGDASSKASYSVVDKKPIGRVTFEFDVTNDSEGCTTETTGHPPVGILKIYTKYAVVGGNLVADTRIDASRMMVGTVKSNVSSIPCMIGARCRTGD